MKKKKIYSLLLGMALLSLLLFLLALVTHRQQFTGPLLIAFFTLLSIGVRGNASAKGFSYTIMIFSAVAISMFYPGLFIKWGNFELKATIVPLLQIIMFGMGSQMSFKDFAGVIKMPKGVLLGLVCQFTIMPVIGFVIASSFGFPPEIAAGIILVGSSPSGLASNVMSFIAKANLALSVTLTAVATLLAPLLTPLLMKLLAGQFVPIDFQSMMMSIVKIVILPIAAGLIFNLLIGGKKPVVEKFMSILSMAGIGIIITVITAAGRDSLMEIGFLLVIACLLHNSAGYLLGYWICRLARMDEKSCRTIALEVGMQNGGLASGIALQMGKVATIGLAPAVFGPLMNITGSSLATWWRRKS